MQTTLPTVLICSGWATGACAGMLHCSRLPFCCNTAERMMSGPVFLLPPLKDTTRFFVRLDADSHVTRPVTKKSDALVAAADGGQMYVFWSMALETCR